MLEWHGELSQGYGTVGCRGTGVVEITVVVVVVSGVFTVDTHEANREEENNVLINSRLPNVLILDKWSMTIKSILPFPYLY